MGLKKNMATVLIGLWLVVPAVTACGSSMTVSKPQDDAAVTALTVSDGDVQETDLVEAKQNEAEDAVDQNVLEQDKEIDKEKINDPAEEAIDEGLSDRLSTDTEGDKKDALEKEGNQVAESEKGIESADEVRGDIIKHYTELLNPEGTLDSFEINDVFVEGGAYITLRYQLSDAEADEVLSEGGYVYPNEYYLAVFVEYDSGNVSIIDVNPKYDWTDGECNYSDYDWNVWE